MQSIIYLLCPMVCTVVAVTIIIYCVKIVSERFAILLLNQWINDGAKSNRNEY